MIAIIGLITYISKCTVFNKYKRENKRERTVHIVIDPIIVQMLFNLTC